MNHRCNECHTKIPTGEAVIRSVSFERVSFHRECWAFHQLPAQRPGVERVAA